LNDGSRSASPGGDGAGSAVEIGPKLHPFQAVDRAWTRAVLPRDPPDLLSASFASLRWNGKPSRDLWRVAAA
jgi:hypothetical protein